MCEIYNTILTISTYQNIKVAEADLATMEKEGLDTGLKAIHPLTKEIIPIWTANFVLMDYGTGVVMCISHNNTSTIVHQNKIS